MHAAARASLERAGCRVADPDRVARDLASLHRLLNKWQRVQNLVSRETLSGFWERHVADSLQLVPLLPERAGHILDLGSGGGFPALPLAIALKERGPALTLVESNGRKVAFLRAVARELALNVQVVDKRIEAVVSRETGPVDVITARALAGLPALCGYSWPFWRPETRALFHKGREHVEEIAESAAQWHHDVVIHDSVVERGGVILELSNLRPLSGQGPLSPPPGERA